MSTQDGAPCIVPVEQASWREPAPLRLAAITNQLLYSVMSSPQLLSWLREYAIEHRRNPPSRHQFIRDFSRAVAEHDGHCVIPALIRSSVENQPVYGFDEAFLHVIFGGIGVFGGAGSATDSGTFQTLAPITLPSTITAFTTFTGMTLTGTRPGTETGTGGTGTGTGTGTEQGTGTGTGTEQ